MFILALNSNVKYSFKLLKCNIFRLFEYSKQNWSCIIKYNQNFYMGVPSETI